MTHNVRFLTYGTSLYMLPFCEEAYKGKTKEAPEWDPVECHKKWVQCVFVCIFGRQNFVLSEKYESIEGPVRFGSMYFMLYSAFLALPSLFLAG